MAMLPETVDCVIGSDTHRDMNTSGAHQVSTICVLQSH